MGSSLSLTHISAGSSRCRGVFTRVHGAGLQLALLVDRLVRTGQGREQAGDPAGAHFPQRGLVQRDGGVLDDVRAHGDVPGVRKEVHGMQR